MQFLIMLTLILIMELTRPVPKPPRRPGINEFSVTTAEQDRRIPWIIGQPWLTGPNLVWYGDLKIGKITQKIKGIFKSKKATVGYEYSIGFHLVFGRSSQWGATLLDIVVGDDPVWSGSLANGNSTINKRSIWGGDDGNGGIAGTFTWMPGLSNQGQNAYLKSKLGGKVPAYRGVFGLSWNRGYHGNSTVMSPWKIRARVLPRGLGSGLHDIAGEANPAEAQYELLTDSSIGLGQLPTDIDIPSFLACAATLHAEGLGMSLAWDSAKSVEDMLKEIDRHVDAVTYLDPVTSLWRMRLIRQDYVLANLPHVNASNSTLLSFSRPTSDELVNELKVVYASEELEGQSVPVQIQDPAAFQAKNRQKVSSEVAYPGFTKKANALHAATRDMRALSYGLARVQLKVNRSLHLLNPVDRFVFDWPELNITNMPMIVMEKEIGTLVSGEITLLAVQDIFGLGTALYTETSSSGWQVPSRTPNAPTSYRMEFSPYWFNLTAEEVQQPTSAVPMLMVEAPDAGHMDYLITYSDPTTAGTMLAAEDPLGFTPTATLVNDYLESAGADAQGTLVLGNLTTLQELSGAALADLQNLGSGLVLVDNEWMGFTGVTANTDGTWTATSVQRGLLDSTIARHLAGAKAWMVFHDIGRTPTDLHPFAAGTYSAKLMPRALGGTLDAGLAPTATITTNGTSSNARPLYPYPVRELSLNGSKVPGQIAATDLVVAWKDSNRLTEATIKVHADAASTREATSVTRCYLYSDSGALLSSSGDITAATWTFASGLVPDNGYVQVETYIAASGASQRATLWFSKAVDYAATQDKEAQLLTAEAGSWAYWRLTD